MARDRFVENVAARSREALRCAQFDSPRSILLAICCECRERQRVLIPALGHMVNGAEWLIYSIPGISTFHHQHKHYYGIGIHHVLFSMTASDPLLIPS